jgi:acylphosphatase
MAKRLHIYGHVQGVWFRESLRRQALKLGISGWVRNRRDGSVEAVVQGSPDALEKIMIWCRRGPDQARVDRVAVSDTTGDFVGFERLPTE